MVGMLMLLILALNASEALANSWLAKKKKDDGENDGKPEGPPSYATSMWFAGLVGFIGGFATILTNSMGPMLNIFLLTNQFAPMVFVSTRATFFTAINSIKVVLRLLDGSLTMAMLILGLKLAGLAVIGVFASKAVINKLSKGTFMKMQYALMTYAGVKLVYAGMQEM